ncbi:MAG: PAS domain S-box protein, partial [Methanoregulaceae archaeon]|nr:PAS domain S-box protein [Methanoregulaceae archaeon]
MISVLLVHDNTDLLEATRQYLERLGEVRVEVVNSTKQALEVLRNRSYDVIVSYYQLPEVNGIEFVADLNGVEFLKLLKQQGIQTPFVLYNRTNRGTVVIEDLNFAAETVCRERSPISELRDVIKQAVLRKRAERELSLRYEQLNALLSATPLAIATLKNRVFEYANGPMSRMLGYEDGYLAGKPAQLVFSGAEEYTRTCRELLVRVDGEGFGHADTVLLKKDTKPVHCHLRMRPADPADPAKGEIWIFEETTAVRALEESLKESELRYRELLQNTSSILMKVDPSGTITFFNKAAQAFFGWSSAEIVGKNVVGTIIANDRPERESNSLSSDLGFSSEGYAIRINEHVLRSGEQVWVSW